MAYQTILFDLDGTLLDTLEDLADAVNHILERHRCPQRTLDEVRLFVGNGLGMLMRYYLDGSFRPEYLAWAGAVRSEEYYVRMMAAWYFATALAKQPQAAWPWVAEPRLDPWVRAKAVQKALESRRISPEQKQALRALRGTFTKGL